MDVNTVASVVSAVCAVIGVAIAAVGLSRAPALDEVSPQPPLSARALYAFLLISSGWVLAVLSFLWIMDPFGPIVTEREDFQIAGIMVSLPALLILRAGFDLLHVSEPKQATRNNVTQTAGRP